MNRFASNAPFVFYPFSKALFLAFDLLSGPPRLRT